MVSLTRESEAAVPAAAPNTDTLTAADDVPQAAITAAALDQVWFNRDMGWLEFNSRVLAEAMDERTPLLERAKFLAIFTSNLDEFFMKRMAVLREDPSAERQALLGEIRSRLDPMLVRQADEFRERLVPGLARRGIHLKRWLDLSTEQRAEANAFFDTQVSPALTPLIIHPSQPFPFFSNLSLSLALVLHDPRTQETIDARVKVPAELAQWVELTSGVAAGSRVFVRLHAVIRENAQKLYPGMRILSTTLFRLTRDAEVVVSEDDFQGLREMVREQIRQRRYEPVVRLEFGPNTDPRVRDLLKKRFSLSDNDIFDLQEELDYTSLFQIASVDVPELRFAPWAPVTPPRLADESNIFDVIREGDVLLHHPYESFDDSVERFIRIAASDMHTVAIKMTVYRVGDDTPFVHSLIKAAEAGKQVACVIELKARFDEERNLHWATELEHAGAHVTVGNINLKTHAKIALVVRKEASGLRSYAHIGTGNYHVRTARLYTDVGLLTCDESIIADVVTLFHKLTGHSIAPTFEKLLVAPINMRQQFIALIQREIDNKRNNRPARVIAKMNQLEDAQIIAALCEASNAGVPIDLVVRGFCCIRPGVAGATENVRVRSIIGRFLEHSRIWYFAAGQEDPLEGEFFIGSADWMYRNLSNRVEVATPVVSRSARARLWEILDMAMQDRRQAWVMDSTGSYQQLRPEKDSGGAAALGTQQMLIEVTRSRAS